MIVRDLLIKLGFQANTSGADKIDGKIVDIKQHSTAAATAIGTFASQLAMMGAQKAAAELQAAAESSIDFGRSMANVSTLVEGGDRRMEQMRKDLLGLSAQFGVMPKDAVDAAYDVIGAMGDTKDAIDQVRASMMLGKATAASSAEGFAILGATTRAYGDTSAAAFQKAGDLAAWSIRVGSAKAPELAGALQNITPIAHTLGLSLEELFTITATFPGTMGSVSEVYTKASSAMTALLKQTPEMKKAFRKAFGKEGIKEAEQAIGKYGLAGTIKKLAATTKGTKSELVDLFGRKEGAEFAFGVLGSQAGEYADKLEQAKKVSGEMANSLEKQTHGMGANATALDKAKASAEKQRIELGDRLAPAYVDLYKIGGQIAKLFGDEIVPLFEGASAQGGNLGLTMENLEPVFKVVQIAIAGIAFSLDMLISQIKLVVTGVATAGAMAKAAASGNWAGVKAAAEAGAKDAEQQLQDFYTRNKNRAAFVLGVETTETATKKFQQRQQQARDSMMAMQERVSPVLEYLGAGKGSALGNFINNMGGVNIAVSVAPGTEASAAARIGDTLLRASLGVLADGVQRSNPVQAPPPQVASVAPSWGKLPGAGVL